MSGFQFIHYEKYKKDDIEGIIGEASRTPGYCPHVENVQPPVVLKGSLQNLQERLQHDVAHYKSAARTARKRRFATMRIFSLPGFSHPDPTAKPGDPAFDKWLDLSMKFVAEEYGAQLHTAVLHLDEEFPRPFLRNPKGLRNVECVPR